MVLAWILFRYILLIRALYSRQFEQANKIDSVRPDVNHRHCQLYLHLVCASP